jgi:hypothetical protein
MKSALEHVNKEWNEAATKMYAQADPQAGAGGPQAQGAPEEAEAAGGSEKQEQAQDADFEVVDDKDEKK